ncbi:MAG: hypothetical protein M3R00_03135, partial [Pseudomonadota bacterium]|nr:hypothetical protein [Pseudomonadota bacterium]
MKNPLTDHSKNCESNLNTSSHYKWNNIALSHDLSAAFHAALHESATGDNLRLPQDIFKIILRNIPFNSWKTLACVNRFYSSYMTSLIKSVTYLIRHALPLPKSNFQHVTIYNTCSTLSLSFDDDFGAHHHLSWPSWYFNDNHALLESKAHVYAPPYTANPHDEYTRFVLTETS